MKRLLYACIALVMAFTTASALAADLTGDWAGDLNTGGGVYPLIYHLKQDGAKLTGNIEGAGGEAIVINDGKIDGDKITFSVQYNGSTISHTGAINADAIKMATNGGEIGPGTITLKRSGATTPPPSPATPSSPKPPAA